MGKRKNKTQDKKKKIALVFDESQRKDFLCGFRKRKLERKKKAQEDIQRLLKEERKRIKQENKESYKKLVVSSRPIPDIEQLLKEEYEDDDVNVKIVELSSDTLQKKDLVIGENRPREEPGKTLKNKSTKPKEPSSASVPGMGSDTEVESAAEEEEEKTDDEKPKSKKELKQMLMRQAQKKIKKSKVFQMKSKLDRVQNKKKSHQKKEHTARLKAKMGKPRKDKPKKSFGRKKH